MASRTLQVVAVIAALAVLSAPSDAQVAYDSPAGRVEILGLKRWTLRMLQDSVRHYVPGQELHSAACMVILRDSLHFAEASVEQFSMMIPGVPSKTLLTIKVIEPEDAQRVQWDNRERNEFASLLPDYASLVLPATDSTGALWLGRIQNWLQFYHSNAAMRAMVLSATPESAKTDAHRVWQFLDDRRTENDRRRAMRVFTRDGFYVNRMVASAVLSNFGASDSTWWVLVRALRDPNEAVRDAAASVLKELPARPIDWMPAANDLRLLLGGTNLPAMGTVLALLDRTEVRPEMASTLLRHNVDWVLATLGSEHPMDHDAAHRLLVRLNKGVDRGARPSDWAPWAESP